MNSPKPIRAGHRASPLECSRREFLAWTGMAGTGVFLLPGRGGAADAAGTAGPVSASAPDPRNQVTEGTAAGEAPLHLRNAAAVQRAETGQSTVASPAWWGFDPADATAALQAAINSKARRVIVPFMGRPWIIRPVRLRSDLELVLEPGVLVWAKPDEFRGRGDSLFSAVDCAHVAVRGYGATLRMRKHDYQHPPYAKAEWRMGLTFTGCRHVRVE
ncbi:MAG: hypothetical protein KGS61_21705, partial [Verrucomicrobia bacterium]|nr:hypothetical protein [Verrucomicrobiota bacterium]